MKQATLETRVSQQDEQTPSSDYSRIDSEFSNVEPTTSVRRLRSKKKKTVKRREEELRIIMAQERFLLMLF